MGCLMPLISASGLLQQEQLTSPELLTVIRLKYSSNDVGIVVDRTLGSITKHQLPPDLSNSQGSDSTWVMMSSQLIPSEIWQPQY